tara:strand:- start:139 stop:504 length:366 start_codon:yes stop_codon:yes gene_type:complete
MKMKKFNFKKKTSILIGRFQPFHEGHYQLFLNGLKKTGQVAILVMDSYNVNKKNPFKFKDVVLRINKRLKAYKNQYTIIKIPVTREVIFGRKVGYKIRNVNLSKKIQLISATKIRKKLNIK